MNLDLTQYYIVISIIAAFIVGYIIKNVPVFEEVANDYIPVVVVIVGAIVACLSQGFTLESIVYGGLSGLASTGFYELIRNMIFNQE